MMELIARQKEYNHASFEIVTEFEKVILKELGVTKIESTNNFLTNFLYFMYALLRKFRIGSQYFTKSGSKAKYSNSKLFCVLMNLDIKKCISNFWFKRKMKCIYYFDPWPKSLPKMVHFIKFFNLDYVFVPSSEAAILLNKELNRDNVYWIPEGVSPEEYMQFDYNNRKIDVLSFGRKNFHYHNLIVDFLERNNRVYLYEKTEGNIIFPSRNDFIVGLAQSKISICFPASKTHPSKSGGQDKMTIRYLQSMISKCLVVGSAPKDMIDLFGYNPVIEIDELNVTGQLEDILNNFPEYIPLIEKNYQTVILNHTWRNRWIQILEIIER